jgi:hypothetical protein
LVSSSPRRWPFSAHLLTALTLATVGGLGLQSYLVARQALVRVDLDGEGHPTLLEHRRVTKHYDIRSDMRAASLQYYESVFEGFFEYFTREWFPVYLDRPLNIYLFESGYAYRAYVAKTGGPETPYGYYVSARNLLVVNVQSGLGTATHELVHHFVARAFPEGRPAQWINEGFAGFFEKFIGRLDPEGRLTISVGYFSNWRFPFVKENVETLGLLKLIVFADGDQSSASAFMLFLHRQNLLRSFMVELIRAGPSDSAGIASLQKICGKDLPAIEREWKDWIRAQPLDDNVALVQRSFVATPEEWESWWKSQQSRLEWNDALKVYEVRAPRAS